MAINTGDTAPMGVNEAATPATIYGQRAEHFAAARDDCQRRWNLVANLRLAAFLFAAFWSWWAYHARTVWPLALACVGFATFVALARYHGRLGRAWRRFAELRAVNLESDLRLARAWDELPLRHQFRAAPDHPYAADLDLYGRASLLQLLQPSSTSMGEATLRAWLLAPTTPETIAARQAAVAELAGQIDLRDELQTQARLVGDAQPDPAPFLTWAEGSPWLLERRGLLWAARLSPILFWITLALWLPGLLPYPLWLVCLLANGVLWRLLGRQARETIGRVAAQEGAFRHYAGSFAVLAGETFATRELERLGADLTADGRPAVTYMQQLARIGRFVVPPSAIVYSLLQYLCLWDLWVLAALERWQAVAGRHARRWLVALGEIEALAALGGLAHAQPSWCYPCVERTAQAVTAHGLGHPYLADGERVANDVTVGPPSSFLLVTGSNMAGKSTLLRALGVNLVLAGAGGPVCARAFRTPPVRLWTSMRVQDSLASGVSYFMAELQRLKAVVVAADADGPEAEPVLLYLLDEILQGTNTAERQIAARRIIAHLVARGAIGAVSTHDLALAAEGPLSQAARPVHFSEQFTEGPTGPTMTFDYHLRPGIATSTNALRLMALVGLTLDPAALAADP
jgi:hypothetical protein